MIFPASSPLLAIDTAGSACSVALWAERGILAHEIAATLHGHAVALAPMIERIAAGAGISLKSVSAVAVSCGPGGFTGMRVGLATARALALSIGCPAIGIDSFAVLAAAARRSTGPLEHGLLVPVHLIHVGLAARTHHQGMPHVVLPVDDTAELNGAATRKVGRCGHLEHRTAVGKVVGQRRGDVGGLLQRQRCCRGRAVPVVAARGQQRQPGEGQTTQDVATVHDQPTRRRVFLSVCANNSGNSFMRSMVDSA